MSCARYREPEHERNRLTFALWRLSTRISTRCVLSVSSASLGQSLLHNVFLPGYLLLSLCSLQDTGSFNTKETAWRLRFGYQTLVGLFPWAARKLPYPQFSSVHLQMVFARSRKPTYAPPRLSEVSPMSSLKWFQIYPHAHPSLRKPGLRKPSFRKPSLLLTLSLISSIDS